MSLNLLMLLDFFFNEDAMKQITDQIAATAGLQGTKDTRKEFDQGLSELIGKEKAGKLVSDMSLYGSYKKFPPELNKPFFFTDITMTYKPEFRAFRNNGYVGLGNIYKTQINRNIKSTVEVVKKRSGDILNIYLELDGSTWYFFSYQRGIMQAISSNDMFNKYIRELKSDKRILKPTGENKSPYQFMLSTERMKNNFLKKAGDEGDEPEKKEDAPEKKDEQPEKEDK